MLPPVCSVLCASLFGSVLSSPSFHLSARVLPPLFLKIVTRFCACCAELEGLPEELVMLALGVLEKSGKLVYVTFSDFSSFVKQNPVLYI